MAAFSVTHRQYICNIVISKLTLMKNFKCAFLRFSSIVLQPYSKNVFSLSLITKLIMYIVGFYVF